MRHSHSGTAPQSDITCRVRRRGASDTDARGRNDEHPEQQAKDCAETFVRRVSLVIWTNSFSAIAARTVLAARPLRYWRHATALTIRSRSSAAGTGEHNLCTHECRGWT